MYRQCAFVEGENKRMLSHCCALTNFAKIFLIDLFFIIVNHSNKISVSLDQRILRRTAWDRQGFALLSDWCESVGKARRGVREDSERARLL